MRRLLMAAGGVGGFGGGGGSPDYGVGMGDSGLTGTSLTKLGVVVAVGGSGSWREALVESPAVWYDPTQAKYGMVYVGYAAGPDYAQIGLAWATDPAGPWTDDAASPILAGSGSGADSAGVTGPFIWIAGSTYHLFYIGLTGGGYEGGAATLCHATSTDLVTWTRHGQIIGTASGWRSSQVYHPSIIQISGTYYLFFNAKGANEAIGYATSTDLSSWTVDDADSPVVNKGTGWESAWIGDPSLYLVGSTPWMAYYGFDGAHAYDGLAEATGFPITWTKYGGNPVLSPSVSYDALYAHKPYIYQNAVGMWHYYTCVSNANVREIAVAEATA